MKKKKNMRSPEERKRERQEILAIIEEARNNKRKEEKAARQRKKSFSFSMDAVRSFISDLEFKKEDAVSENIDADSPSNIIEDKVKPQHKETYYERWYLLVAGKQPESNSSIPDFKIQQPLQDEEKPSPLPERHGQPWNKEEEEQLRLHYSKGYPPKAIAHMFKRSLESIKARLGMLGLIDYEYKKPDPHHEVD